MPIANLMLGRNFLGKHILASVAKTVGGVVIIDYPKTDSKFAFKFYNREGVKTGEITASTENHPVIDFEFELTQNGCGKFSFSLMPDHGLTIGYNQRVDIHLFGSGPPWYSGYIQTRPVPGTTENKWTYKGYGFFQELETIIISKQFQGMKLGSIVNNLVTVYIEPETNIVYNYSKIEHPDYTATDLLFDYVTAKDALKQIAELAIDHIYGVDEERQFFFKKINTEINEKARLWVGIHVKDFKPEEDTDKLLNFIYVKGGSIDEEGSNIMYECSDESSIEEYGLRKGILTIPSALAVEDAQRWGNSQLDKCKEPEKKAKIDGITKEVISRKITPDGMARITSADGKYAYDYPIKTVRCSLANGELKQTIELGEYDRGWDPLILKLYRDIKDAEIVQRTTNAQLKGATT